MEQNCVHFLSPQWASQTLVITEGSAPSVMAELKVHFLRIFQAEKLQFTVKMFGRYVSCEKLIIYLLLPL